VFGEPAQGVDHVPHVVLQRDGTQRGRGISQCPGVVRQPVISGGDIGSIAGAGQVDGVRTVPEQGQFVLQGPQARALLESP
jgi:hypothetical protein